MAIYHLIPALKDYIWGGTKLKKYRKTNLDIISESWELSFHEDGLTMIQKDGKLVSLKEVVTKDDLGENAKKFPFFPVLIKLIDAKDNLSVQVHPSDAYALKNENSYGKTEMWYVLDAEEGSGLYVGFKGHEDEVSIQKALEEGTILEHLNFFQVQKGDCYFIPSGTIHAIGKGVTLIEIQQNSNLTYRLYDYNRLGKDGKPRPLHIEKALKVIDYHPYEKRQKEGHLLGQCEYFETYAYEVKEMNALKEDDSFCSITFLDGEGTINGLPYHTFDSFFISAKEEVKIIGTGHYVLTKVGK